MTIGFPGRLGYLIGVATSPLRLASSPRLSIGESQTTRGATRRRESQIVTAAPRHGQAEAVPRPPRIACDEAGVLPQ